MLYLVVLMSAIFAFLLLGAATALVISYFPDSATVWRAAWRAIHGRDAAIALLAAVGLAMIVGRADAVLAARFHAQALFSIDSPDLIVSAAPAVAAIAGSVRSTLTLAAVVALLALTLIRWPSRWMIAALVLLTPLAILPLDIHRAGEFALQYGMGVMMTTAGAAFCLLFARGNYLAYVLVLWAAALRGPVSEMMGSGNSGLQMQGWAVLAVLITGIAWALLPAAKKRIN
jgi:hypothetical protein